MKQSTTPSQTAILIVAPDSELETIAELIAAAGGNRVEVLNGQVGQRELLSTIARESFWAIHFAGQGNNLALALSDGPLNMDMFQQVISAASLPRLVLLNACETAGHGVAAYSVGVNYVIAWPGKVNDKAAAEFAVTFWNTWRYSRNVSRSFETAQDMLQRFYPGHQLPILLNGRLSVMQQHLDEINHRLANQERNRFPNYVVYILLALLSLSLLTTVAVTAFLTP